jgi:hypothetical protein
MVGILGEEWVVGLVVDGFSMRLLLIDFCILFIMVLGCIWG